MKVFIYLLTLLSLPLTAFANLNSRTECEQKITQSICVTTASADTIGYRGDAVACDLNAKEAATFLPALMLIYDELPDVAQPVFCHLKKIFISDRISSTAFAGYLSEDGYQISAGYIGMRKGTLTRQPVASDLSTWKEQLLFGGSDVFLSRDPNKVGIEYDLKLQHLKQDGLFYVVLHELGHVVDFFNGISGTRMCGNNCLKTPERWNTLSWQGYQPIKDLAFYKQDSLCFYNCYRFLADNESPQIYRSLRDSGFITTYSGVNPTEDFAEFFAWHLLRKTKGAELRVVLPGGEVLDMTPAFTQNGAVARKMGFIESLVSNPSLKLY